MKDYYKTLSLDPAATQEEIKKSFRKLAQKYHPDKNLDDKSSDAKFKEVNEAYQVLSDKSKRKEYDFHRMGGFSNHGNFDPFAGFGDLFGDIFGRAAGHAKPRKPQRRRDAAVSFDVSVQDLRTEQVLNTSFSVMTDVDCVDCNGKGGESLERCGSCNGTGQITTVFAQGGMRFQQSSACSNCQGTGTIIKNVCRTCLGNGFIRKEEIFDVQVQGRLRKR